MRPGGSRRGRPVGSGWRTLLLVLCVAAASAGLAQELTDEMRLREGIEAYRSRRPADAVTPLRIAVFGFLDRPRELCEGLHYLALAQDAAGNRGDAEGVARRLSEIERRFPACAQAPVDPPARAQFEARFPRAGGSNVPARAQAPPLVPAPAPARPVETRRTPEPAVASKAPDRPERVAAPGSDGTRAGAGPDTPPRVTKSVPAVYPRAAREARLVGVAVVRVLVSEAGRPVRLEAMSGPRPLTEAAMAAIRRWTFEPARRDGREVQAWTVIEIPFQP